MRRGKKRDSTLWAYYLGRRRVRGGVPSLVLRQGCGGSESSCALARTAVISLSDSPCAHSKKTKNDSFKDETFCFFSYGAHQILSSYYSSLAGGWGGLCLHRRPDSVIKDDDFDVDEDSESHVDGTAGQRKELCLPLLLSRR